MPKELLYAAWAFAAGAGIPIMAVLNSGLARVLGSASAAVVVLLLVGLAAAIVVLMITGGVRVSEVQPVAAVPWMFATGGLIFVFYIFSVTLLVPRFGVANTILCVVVAQIVVSTVIDQFGLFGMPVRPVDGLRLVGLGLVLAGLVVTQSSSGRALG
ncbi:MAG: DMT family transporter, partial [Verrucomicrobiae bacterium]|nr:DMT family transporter [Verrucomicrobiae bacterium]